jgi:hypothetical protein
MDKTALHINSDAGAPIVRNFSGLENIDCHPESYVDLQYDERGSRDYVRVSARNRHPDKAIRAYFCTIHEAGDHCVPEAVSGSTIKACLMPSETTVIHFMEKNDHPRLFLFNAAFADRE